MSLSLIVCIGSNAQQSVGINTTNPQATLDVRGSYRLGGVNNYSRYDSLTGRIEWINSAIYTPVSQQIIKHSNSSEGLYAGGGKLEYRNTTSPVFFSDWTTGNGYFKNNLGINNLNPQFPLSFNGSLGDKISLWTDGTPTHYGFGIQSSLFQMFSKTDFDDIAFGIGSSSAFTERMRIKGNGNVGIGISSPVARLHVMNGSSGGSAPSSNLLVESNGTNYLSMLAPDASANGIWFSKPSALLGGGIFYNDPVNPDGLLFRANNSPRMVIKNNGNVGIGLNNPQSRLHIVNGSSGATSSFPDLVVESSTNTYLNFLTPDVNESGVLFGTASNSASGGIIYNNANNLSSLQFRVGGNNTAVIIDNNQRLGVRMTPISTLSVGQLFGGSDVIGLYSLSLFGGYTASWRIGFSGGDRLSFSSLNGQVAYVDATTGSWVAISDAHLKKNITSLGSVLPRLMQLKPVSYQMNSQHDDEITFGFLAQEVQKVFPEAVKEFSKGKGQTLGLSYSVFIPLAISAIQEQERKIEKMEKEIAELKELITRRRSVKKRLGN